MTLFNFSALALVAVLSAGAPAQSRGRLALDVARDPLTAADARGLGLKDPAGVFVQGVEPGGPAHAAGIRAEDVIVAFNGRTPSGAADLASWISGTPPGERVKVTVMRHGAAVTMEVVVAAAAPPPATPAAPVMRKVTPAPESATAQDIGFGLRLSAVDPQVPGGPPRGAHVTAVVSRGGADRGGLAVGDVILKMNGVAITSPSEATKILDGVASGSSVRVLYWRPDGQAGLERATFLVRP